MPDAIRIEADGAAGLDRTQAWLSRHRGRTVELDRTLQLEFGVPISGAGAVLVAVTVEDAGSQTPQIGGVVRAIADRAGSNLVRLVFEGRSPARLDHDLARSLAERTLGVISRLVLDELAEEVA